MEQGLLLFTEIASNAKIAKDRPKLEGKTIETRMRQRTSRMP